MGVHRFRTVCVSRPCEETHYRVQRFGRNGWEDENVRAFDTEQAREAIVAKYTRTEVVEEYELFIKGFTE